MTLKEFDQIRPFLPENTEVTINTDAGPVEGQKWAVELVDWGNHDGRFNIHCQACGWYSEDIPRSLRPQTETTALHKPCPKCGAKFLKIPKGDKT